MLCHVLKYGEIYFYNFCIAADSMNTTTQQETVQTPEHESEVSKKRPKPGERRVQILQTLAAMLEGAGAERITTAALAKKLDVSEAALYRHFASKAQMFEIQRSTDGYHLQPLYW